MQIITKQTVSWFDSITYIQTRVRRIVCSSCSSEYKTVDDICFRARLNYSRARLNYSRARLVKRRVVSRSFITHSSTRILVSLLPPLSPSLLAGRMTDVTNIIYQSHVSSIFRVAGAETASHSLLSYLNFAILPYGSMSNTSKPSAERNLNVPSNLVSELNKNQYVIVDNFIELQWADRLLSEGNRLVTEGHLKQHLFQFGNTLYEKPNIFELDLHDQQKREQS